MIKLDIFTDKYDFTTLITLLMDINVIVNYQNLEQLEEKYSQAQLQIKKIFNVMLLLM